MTAQILVQLPTLPPRGGTLPGAQGLGLTPTLGWAGGTPLSGTCCFADRSEVLVQVWPQSITIPVVVKHKYLTNTCGAL